MHWHAQTCRETLRTLQNQSQLNFERRIWSAWLMDKLHWSRSNWVASVEATMCAWVCGVWGVSGRCGRSVVDVCGCHLVKCSKHRTLRRFVCRNRTRSTQSPDRPGSSATHRADSQSWLIDTQFVCMCATTHTKIPCEGHTLDTLDCPGCHTPETQLSCTLGVGVCAHRICQIIHVFIMMYTLFMHSITFIRCTHCSKARYSRSVIYLGNYSKNCMIILF